MKNFIILLGLCLWGCQLYAQQTLPSRDNSAISLSDSTLFNQEEYPDSLFVVAGPFMTPVVFEVNQYTIKPNQRLNEAIDSIKKYNRNIIFIWVGGSASPEGPDRWNRQLGQYRAEALSKYIIQETGLEN